ncbi:VOC family protein [Nonomuraea sp. NPDC049709]|uniref:VOC family protein n=1 Tax=Nonomuraea sp. NPDC049709 TaxID=3154736 RepID=UPI003422A2D0
MREGRLGDWAYRIVFSRYGPLYTELIEGPAGSPWDPGGGARCDHRGFWASRIDDCAARLAEKGWPLDFDARPYGRPFTYHWMTGLGLRLELVDVSVQPEPILVAEPEPAASLGLPARPVLGRSDERKLVALAEPEIGAP